MKNDFDAKFFQKKQFENKTILKYYHNALKDFRIALRDNQPEVIFNFSYFALIKIGLALIAKHNYRVKSRVGHHIQILAKLSQILNDQEIEIIGDRMRKKRNLDLYEGGLLISHKEAMDYLNFVKKIIRKSEEYFKSQNPLL